METDRKPNEGDPKAAAGVTKQSAMPPPDEEEVWASTVITTYLLAQSEEFQQLSQLRHKVSLPGHTRSYQRARY